MNPVVGALVLSQVCVGVSQIVGRQAQYRLARSEADRRGKPLLVVGGPYGAGIYRKLFHLKAHGFGDVCTDIDPQACEGAPRVVAADILDLPFADKEFGAAFVGHVFRHLHGGDNDIAWGEVSRVADSVYYSDQSRFWLLGYIAPGL
jgi:hypothetical protein